MGTMTGNSGRRHARISQLLRTTAAIALAAAVSAPSIASADTLQEALVSAYQSNPTLAAERARLRATDEGVAQAKSAWRPTVTVGTSYGTRRTESENGTTIGGTSFSQNRNEETNPFTVEAEINQPLYRGGSTAANNRQAKALVRAGRADLASVEQQVFQAATQAYFDVLRDAAVVELNRNNVTVLRRQLDAADDRFRVGEITRTDVAQAEARLALAQSDLIASEAQLVASRETYEQVVGSPPGVLDNSPPLPALPQTEEEAIAVAYDNDPDIVAARENENAARHLVRSIKGELLPRVSLEGSLSHTEDTTARPTEESDTAQALATFSVPLYESGSVYSRVREAKQLASRSRILITETQRATQADVSTSWENLRSARARIRSDREQVRANEIAYEGVRQETRVGSRTTLDLLDAEQELLNARVALVRSQRDEYVAAYGLLAAIGGLTAGTLGLPTELYDPQENYEAVRNKAFGFGIPQE